MYNKLFTKILDSSVWLASLPTRIVWVTFIAAMDETGFCAFAAPGNVALRARVSLKQAQDAIAALESPDGDSSDPENEGRRIERVPGGWMVLNAEKYRAIVLRAESQRLNRIRVARHRAKKRDVTPCNETVMQSEANTEANTEAKIKPSRSTSRPRAAAPEGFAEFWTAYPRKTGKGAAERAWAKARPNLPSVLSALEWQSQQPQWLKDAGQFIPNPATWLNQGRWDDLPFDPPSTERPQRRWDDECQELHGGTCESRYLHQHKLDMDGVKSA